MHRDRTAYIYAIAFDGVKNTRCGITRTNLNK